MVKTNLKKSPAKVQNIILPILNMDVTPFVVSGLFCLIFGLSVELIGRNPLNMLRISEKEEGSAMKAEGSVITSEDPAITSEGSALKNDDSVKESENLYPYWRIDISPVSFKMRVDTMIFSEKNLQSSLSASNTRWRSNPLFLAPIFHAQD